MSAYFFIWVAGRNISTILICQVPDLLARAFLLYVAIVWDKNANDHVIYMIIIYRVSVVTHWRRKQLMVGGAKVIVDSAIMVVLGCLIH